MIIKYFNLKKSLEEKINFYLLYGQNTGLIENTINNVLKPSFSKNIFYYDEIEILSNIDAFKEKIYNKSFFENDKLIIINRSTDKLLNIIQELTETKTEDLKIIIKSQVLEKKSKLRNFFEKSNEGIIVPFYEDDHQTLMVIAQNFFKQKKIRITPENINFLVKKAMGNRINLENELEKIANYCKKKLSIGSEEILKLTNLAENYNFSTLTDFCLAKNKRKTIDILNENNTSNEDNILILKTFLFKLKRLKKLKQELEVKKNTDFVISSFKPPIFWKDKDMVKQQLRVWTLEQIQSLILKVNDLELLVKKNSLASSHLVNDFILEKLNLSNNSI